MVETPDFSPECMSSILCWFKDEGSSLCYEQWEKKKKESENSIFSVRWIQKWEKIQIKYPFKSVWAKRGKVMSLGKEGDMLVCELGAHERKTLQRFGVANHSRWNHSSKGRWLLRGGRNQEVCYAKLDNLQTNLQRKKRVKAKSYCFLDFCKC